MDLKTVDLSPATPPASSLGPRGLAAFYSWHSRRAQLARYGRIIQPWQFVFELLSVVLFFFGLGLLVLGVSLGWVVLGFSVIPAMVLQWFHAELKDVPLGTDRSIDGRMDSDLLALLSKNPTPKEIALALMHTNCGIFFDVRFGIGGSFLKEVASESTNDTLLIFEEALVISDQTSGRISSGVIILAMLRQIPSRDAILGHLQLSEDDLMRGINWYHYLSEMINSSKDHSRHNGGIGRDWSFGWIPQLTRFGINISEYGSNLRPGVRPDTLNQLMQILGNGGGVVALVGRDGVGKTELVYELASRLIEPDDLVPKSLRFQQVFMLDASRIISVAGQTGQLEGLVASLLSEAYTAKNIIICLDNAELFFEEGVGSVDLTASLLPIIEAGSLPMVLTMDEQRFLQISKRTPALANALKRIMVQPTNEDDTMRVLEQQLPLIEHKNKVTFMYQALKEAYSLSGRYIYDIAMPGQAISLLSQAADYADNKFVTSKSVQQAIERTTGVKPGAANEASEKEILLNLEALLHQQVIGQERAVKAVSDALRRSRAGVGNQNRPVGTFLFLGPTGVGKTELAKALARTYFGGEGTIIRLDMNEFVSPNDVSRLIADGAEDAASLTAQVMKRPFSVVLLDEIEKAHSSVLTTLLQLLDEGVLRDVRNREISFKDTIVIATSNAGADRIQEYIERGYTLERFEESFINELISSHIFHPEFLNRFDEMVVFAPLNKTQLLSVVDLILADVNKSLASQKISVQVAQDAKELLVEAGYDPRLGARPMRRVVQKAVENTVANLLLSDSIVPGSVVEISRDQVATILQTKTQADEIAAGA